MAKIQPPSSKKVSTAGIITGIRPLWFFLAFGIGLLACYLMAPAPEVVIKFPSPYNAGEIVYRDEKTDSCFVYEADKVDCKAAGDKVKSQPL